MSSYEAIQYAEAAALYIDKGNFQEGISCCTKALELDPELPEVLYNLGYASGQTGNLKKAVYYFKKYLKVRPDDAEAWVNLGSTYHFMKRKSAAKRCAKKAIKLGYRP